MKLNPTRLLALLIAALLLLAFILYQAGYFSNAKPKREKASKEASTPPPTSPAALPVVGKVVQFQELTDYISVSGSTSPTDEVMVSSEVPGKVKKIFFQEGEYVKAGTRLVLLDDEELQAQRNRLEVQAQLNEKIAARLKGLYEKQGVSLQEYEVAEAEYAKALSELNLLDVQLKKRVIYAPFSGRLGLRLISEGSYLAPGTPIVSLVNSNPIKLEFSVPEKYSRMIHKGSRVSFTVEGVSGSQTAVVEAADPVIDPTTRTFQLKATASNPGGKIMPGSFANVRVNLAEFESTVMVPTEAIVPELGGKKVYVSRNGKAEAVSVETGIRQASNIQITKGLSAGDTLITTGVLQLRSGMPVTFTDLKQQ